MWVLCFNIVHSLKVTDEWMTFVIQTTFTGVRGQVFSGSRSSHKNQIKFLLHLPVLPAPASFLLPITRSFSQLAPAMDIRMLRASTFPILFLSPFCFFLTPLSAVGRPMYSNMLNSLSPVMPPLPWGSTKFSDMSGNSCDNRPLESSVSFPSRH